MKLNGKRITLFLAMLLLSVSLCGCGTEENMPAAEEPAAETENGPIRVSTVDELLAAIAPDADIILEDGVYTLSEAADYGRKDGRYYQWLECYDGYELQISNVSGLRISGSGRDKVTVSALPRYANVLSFRDCSALCLKGFTAGHRELPGICMGGVLNFSLCYDVDIEECSLFGCGILGVQAYNCRKLHTLNSEIYDCSFGGVYVSGCRDVLFDGCRIHDCTGWTGLLDVTSSSEVAVINSELYDNATPVLLKAYYTDGLYLGGDAVRSNTFTEGMFALSGYPATVEGCGFSENNHEERWYISDGLSWNGDGNIAAVDENGSALDGPALEAMERRENVTWTARERTAAEISGEALPSVSEDGAVHVSTVDEFLAAIAPDTTIYLEDGVYEISTATGYGSSGTDYYRWGERFDGPALEIHDVRNLTIMAGGADRVTIMTKPRYADVMSFENSAGIVLSGFTAGHTETPGDCSGGVLYFSGCDATHIENCSLYGCGILGITALNCEGLEVTATEIRDCSCGAVSLSGCFDVRFEKCRFHDNKGPDFTAYNCLNAYADGDKIRCIDQ